MVKKHWTESVKAENVELRRQLDDLRMQHHVARFAGLVGDNIMTVLANTPYDRWPHLAKMAFKHASEHQETIAYLYQQRLPK